MANPLDNCVDISILNDTRVEGDETLAVVLLVTDPDVMVFRDSANITIIDDDCEFDTVVIMLCGVAHMVGDVTCLVCREHSVASGSEKIWPYNC